MCAFVHFLSPYLPPLLIANLISFSMGLFLTYNWSTILLLVPVTQHSDSIFLYNSKWSPDKSIVTLCDHTEILQTYWQYSPYCKWHTCDSCSEKFEPLNLLHVFLSVPHSPLATTCSFSVCNSVSVCNVHLFFRLQV